MRELVNRGCIVYGASAGIGRAIATGLVDNGATVIGCARRTDRLKEVEASLNRGNGPGKFLYVVGDVTEADTLRRADEALQRETGAAPNLYVVNAGLGLPGTILESDEEKWDEIFQVNGLAALRQMRHAGKRLSEGSAAQDNSAARDIIVIGSVVGSVVSSFNPVYGATKFAINSSAEALRQEMAPRNVRVTLIAPGIVRTEFQFVAGYDMEAFNRQEAESGPYLSGEDIASFVVYAVRQAPHVNFSSLIIRPTRQQYP